LKLNISFIETIVSRSLILFDLILDSFTIVVFLIIFIFILKFLVLLGHEDLLKEIANFYLNFIIIFSVGATVLIRFCQKYLFMPSTSRYKLERYRNNTELNKNCVLLDKRQGRRYPIILNYKNLILVRLLYPVSHMVFGLIIASILSLFDIFNIFSLSFLIFAYIINIIMDVSENYVSFTQRIHSFLSAPLIHSTFETQKSTKSRNKSRNKALSKILSNGSVLIELEEILSTLEIFRIYKKVINYFHLGVSASETHVMLSSMEEKVN
jgi:hypothetical protein